MILLEGAAGNSTGYLKHCHVIFFLPSRIETAKYLLCGFSCVTRVCVYFILMCFSNSPVNSLCYYKQNARHLRKFSAKYIQPYFRSLIFLGALNLTRMSAVIFQITTVTQNRCGVNVCDYGSCCNFLDGCGGRMNSVSCPNHLRMEASVLVSGVVYGAGGAICFRQLVVACVFIPITFFSLFLDVVSVVVLHSVLEFIFSWSLKKLVTSFRIDYSCLCTSHESIQQSSCVVHHSHNGQLTDRAPLTPENDRLLTNAATQPASVKSGQLQCF